MQDHYIILRYFSSELKGCKVEIKVGIRKTCKWSSQTSYNKIMIKTYSV
jgi:hypothetical protein